MKEGGKEENQQMQNVQVKAALPSAASLSANSTCGIKEVLDSLPTNAFILALPCQAKLHRVSPIVGAFRSTSKLDSVVVSGRAKKGLEFVRGASSKPPPSAAPVTTSETNQKVKKFMKKRDEFDVFKEGDLLIDQLVKLKSKGCWCLVVVDASYHLIGTFMDGDLRRILKAKRKGFFRLSLGQVCNRLPKTIGQDISCVEAMKKMESLLSTVNFLPVIDDQNFLVGLISLHRLVSAGT